MFNDKSLKKTNTHKFRVDDYQNDFINEFREIYGGEFGVFVRNSVLEKIEDWYERNQLIDQQRKQVNNKFH
jgi:hypothetical protein